MPRRPWRSIRDRNLLILAYEKYGGSPDNDTIERLAAAFTEFGDEEECTVEKIQDWFTYEKTKRRKNWDRVWTYDHSVGDHPAAAGLGLAWNDKNDQGQNEDKDEEEEEVGESSSGHQNNRTGTGARRSEVLETHIRSLDINSNKTPMSRTLQRENPAHNTYLSNFNEGERDLPTAFANIDEDQQDLLVTFPDTIFKRSDPRLSETTSPGEAKMAPIGPRNTSSTDFAAPTDVVQSIEQNGSSNATRAAKAGKKDEAPINARRQTRAATQAEQPNNVPSAEAPVAPKIPKATKPRQAPKQQAPVQDRPAYVQSCDVKPIAAPPLTPQEIMREQMLMNSWRAKEGSNGDAMRKIREGYGK